MLMSRLHHMQNAYELPHFDSVAQGNILIRCFLNTQEYVLRFDGRVDGPWPSSKELSYWVELSDVEAVDWAMHDAPAPATDWS